MSEKQKTFIDRDFMSNGVNYKKRKKEKNSFEFKFLNQWGLGSNTVVVPWWGRSRILRSLISSVASSVLAAKLFGPSSFGLSNMGFRPILNLSLFFFHTQFSNFPVI